MQIIEQVQKQIGRGELSEALDSLKGIAEGSNHYRFLIALEAQLSFNQKNIQFSLQSYDVISIERNRITHAILEIAALIEHEIVSSVEESKIYLYKARAHSLLKDSYSKQSHLEKLKKASGNETIKEIKNHNEYLQLRIEKLDKINKRLTLIIGIGILTSLVFDLYVAKLIKDFVIWDKLNSSNSNPEISLIMGDDFELSSTHETLNEETSDNTSSNHEKETFRNIKSHEIDHHSIFLHGSANNTFEINNGLIGLTDDVNLILPNHDFDSTSDFDVDIHT